MAPVQWDLIAAFFISQGLAVTIVLWAVGRMADKKVNHETFQLFVESTEKRFNEVLCDYRIAGNKNSDMAVRVGSLEEKYNIVEREIAEMNHSISEIKNDVRGIDGNIVTQIKQFRDSLEEQMKLNQKLLMEKK